ncbi:hypothetical protein ACFL2F_01165 [Myxococcota bacterium]
MKKELLTVLALLVVMLFCALPDAKAGDDIWIGTYQKLCPVAPKADFKGPAKLLYSGGNEGFYTVVPNDKSRVNSAPSFDRRECKFTKKGKNHIRCTRPDGGCNVYFNGDLPGT